MPNILTPLIKSVIRSVRSSATNAGGMVTWEFSQMLPPVSSLIQGNKASAGGICEFLSAKWIECHAMDDHLANWLSSGNAGTIDASKIRLLMQLFVVGAEMPAGKMVEFDFFSKVDQTVATMFYLGSKGIIARAAINPIVRSSENNYILGGSRGGGMRRVMARNLATQIVSNRNSSGSYRAIGIWGPGGAHAMAAWVGQDVAFFDPNFGEFWFESQAGFVNWFPTFWQKSHYSNPRFGLSDRYELVDYSRAA